MFYVLYNLLSLVLLVPVCLYHLYRSISRGRKAAFGERFGLLPAEELSRINGRPVIWLHAVSVGETIAARPLLKALRERYPGHAIALSTTTETGRSIAAGYREKDLCLYFPFDFLPAVCRTLEQLQPQVIVIMETEIWPNFMREASRRSIPVLLANGRISDRSFAGYLRFRWFFRQPLQLFSSLCMQTADDRDRIVAIGAPAERTLAVGNLKYDIPFRAVSADEQATLRSSYGIPKELTVICAGSTHPGEEDLVLEALQDLLAGSSPPLFLVLVPRHPERADSVAALLERNRLAYRRRTRLGEGDTPFSAGQVLLVDTVGELMSLYALSDLVFVGGSLVPTGGHNLLEPAAVGRPTLFGPHMNNFREIAALVLSYRAGLQVESAAELAAACRGLIGDPQQRAALGTNGLRMMQENGGATGRHMQIIGGYL